MRIHDSMKTHCIVQTSLDMTCSMRCSTVKVCDTDRDRLCATLEVWSYWCGQDTELVLVSRFNTDNRVTSKHIRTYIQSCTRAIWWYICFICLDRLYNSLYKTVFREYRHFQSSCRICKTLCVEVRTECYDMSVFCCIGFHTFKYSLCILEYTCTLIQCNIRICGQSSFVPFTIFEVGNITIICRNIAESDATPVNVLFFHNISSSIRMDIFATHFSTLLW